MNDPYKDKTMRCPTCPDSALMMTDRQGIEIDYCPSCRGVWLDRGELDKLIERSASASASATPVRSGEANPARQPEFVDSDYRQDRHRTNGRKKSWLSDIFD